MQVGEESYSKLRVLIYDDMVHWSYRIHDSLERLDWKHYYACLMPIIIGTSRKNKTGVWRSHPHLALVEFIRELI